MNKTQTMHNHRKRMKNVRVNKFQNSTSEQIKERGLQPCWGWNANCSQGNMEIEDQVDGASSRMYSFIDRCHQDLWGTRNMRCHEMSPQERKR